MILIVDDDASVTASLALLFKRQGHATRTASSPAEALAILADEPCRAVVQDMNFSRAGAMQGTSGEEGLELLRQIKRRQPELPVILITAWGSIELAVQGMQAGAADFITKPWSNPQLLQAVETVLEVAEVRAEQHQAERRQEGIERDELDRQYDFGGIVGRHPKLLRILDLIGRVSATDASVLITGESGTGKELLAEAIHRNGKRRAEPFVRVNLGGISSTLFESEMFGHVRGAFTDARKDRTGRFALADRGTIFLDEIGEVDPSAQVKLLRVLQDRTYEVLGSSTTRRVDVRVISATNRDLPKMVEQGSFREDLLYRLNLIAVELPPLRERRSDVPLLAEHLVKHCGRLYGREGLELSPSAVDWLASQSWPGNVRQLKQVIERAVLLARGDTIGSEELLDLDALGQRERRDRALPAVGAMTLEEVERAMVVKALAHHGGNITRVAKALGLSRAALYRRCEKFGIESAPSAPSGAASDADSVED
ncbi:MAG: sigma-54 dependent transcriptional regulator [Acidobacteriota bacterium]